MVALKSSVKLAGLTPQITVALIVASSIAQEMQRDLVVTSANDSKHMAGSKHYSGEALDFRTHDWAKDAKESFVNRLRAALGPNFDVIQEDMGGPNEHCHVEFDPK